VLVVDDDPYIRDVVAQLLEGEGYRIEEATNGAEALGVVNDADRRPNVILLDLMMPVMDGWEFARRLQEHVPPLNIPIVVLSAARLPSDRLTVLGAQAVLAKPFDVDELLEQVARVLGGPPGGLPGMSPAWAPSL
jgi:CheY-like chemotaxis protein